VIEGLPRWATVPHIELMWLIHLHLAAFESFPIEALPLMAIPELTPWRIDWEVRPWDPGALARVEASFDGAAAHWETLQVGAASGALARFVAHRVGFLLATDRAQGAAELCGQAIQSIPEDPLEEETPAAAVPDIGDQDQGTGPEEAPGGLDGAMLWHLWACAERRRLGIAAADGVYRQGIQRHRQRQGLPASSFLETDRESTRYLLLAQGRMHATAGDNTTALQHLLGGTTLAAGRAACRAAARHEAGPYAWLLWAQLEALAEATTGKSGHDGSGGGGGGAAEVYRQAIASAGLAPVERRLVALCFVEHGAGLPGTTAADEARGGSGGGVLGEALQACLAGSLAPLRASSVSLEAELRLSAARQRLTRSLPSPVRPAGFPHRVAVLCGGHPAALGRFLDKSLARGVCAPLAMMAVKGKLLTGDTEAARRILAVVTEQRPWDEAGWYAAALVEERDGNMEEAGAILREAMAVRAMPAAGKAVLAQEWHRLSGGEGSGQVALE